MPNYSYICENCDHIFEETHLMKDHDLPMKKPCPKCGEKKVKQIILSVPGFAIDTAMRVTNKATGGFKDAMQKTLSGIKGTKAERYWKNRYGI